MKNFLIASSALVVCASAHAQAPAIDGTAEAVYGAPAGIQAVTTGFGNATDGLRGTCNGSEIDAIYGKVDAAGGYLYLVIAGNLQSNFNKLEVFIDAKPGGQNALRSDNADVDFNGLNRMGPDAVNALPGLKFDAGFEPDLYFTCTGGNAPYTLYANFAQLLTAGGGVGAYIGSSVTDATSGNILINDTTYGLQVAMNNSNVAGVDGTGGASSSGAGVTTGVEVRIPLSSVLGWDGTSPIKVCAFVNGGGHDYASNQFIGALPAGQGNLGGDGTGGYVGGSTAAIRFDLASFAGDQFVVIGGGTPPPPVCPADLDGDHVVGGSDLGAMLGAWGACSGACPADLDRDGIVGGSDLGSMLGAWGACP
jgi:hypothetical protein